MINDRNRQQYIDRINDRNRQYVHKEVQHNK